MKPLNEIERKFFEIVADTDYDSAIKKWASSSIGMGERRARAAAQVAIEFAEEAHRFGIDAPKLKNRKEDFTDFLTSKGIDPKAPDFENIGD